jgi:hypothetical protein
MWRELISRVFRVHHSVTKLAAELNGIGELIGSVATNHAHTYEDDYEAEKESEGTALSGIVEVETKTTGGFAEFRCRFAPIDHNSRDNQHETENKEPWCHHIRKNANIWTGVCGGEIDEEEKNDIAKCYECHSGADDRYRVLQQFGQM